MATAANSSSPPPSPAIDPRSGFCAATKTFHSLRPHVPLPPSSIPLSFPSYAFSLLPSPLPSNPAFIFSATGATITYPDFLNQVRTLASSLHRHLRLSNGHVAFILSPATLDVPVLYFALLSIGVVVCPANPASTLAEISRQIALVAPSVVFAVSSTADNLPRDIPTILLDSPQFHSLAAGDPAAPPPSAVVRQSDTAAIQFSSGTTGRMKAAALSHRSFIAMTAGFLALDAETAAAETTMMTAPLFHSMGFIMALKGVALGETTVVVGRCGLPELLRAAERYRATALLAAPPLVVAMAMSEEAVGFDLSELRKVTCGGAPLAEQAAERFSKRFPGVEIRMGYGLTEGGGIARMNGPEECRHLKSVGRLSRNVEAKIVDTITGETLSVDQQGELWTRGPTTMTSYLGDKEENALTFSSDGWLKTGDLCYFNHDGYLFIVDRLKEMIKYKAYQVSPVELEHLLLKLPEIVDVAVIPYSHEEVGQIPMALVVRQPGSKISEDEIINFISEQGYGLTEAGGISLMNGPEECRHLKSVGRLSRNVEAKIVDTITGETLSIDQQGELWLRGPTIMSSYLGDQVENSVTFSSDGWLKTGDLCYFNHDGYLFIVDRLKEMIKYKAYQVSPVELEHLLQTLPEIVDVAVIPYSHEEVGQIPMALVVRQLGSKISEDEIMNFISERVAPYKKIRRVAFVNSIPKSPAGKILRRELASLVNCGSTSSL